MHAQPMADVEPSHYKHRSTVVGPQMDIGRVRTERADEIDQPSGVADPDLAGSLQRSGPPGGVASAVGGVGRSVFPLESAAR